MELNDLYSSPHVDAIKSRRMRRAEHVARMGDRRDYIQGFNGEN
jgi:hypothetical protein